MATLPLACGTIWNDSQSEGLPLYVRVSICWGDKDDKKERGKKKEKGKSKR